MNDVSAAMGMGLLHGLRRASARLADQHHRLVSRQLRGIEAGERMVLRMGDMARRIFMGLAHVDDMAGLFEAGLLEGVMLKGRNARLPREAGQQTGHGHGRAPELTPRRAICARYMTRLHARQAQPRHEGWRKPWRGR